MKLKNKKTGEIKPAEAREDGIYLYDETTEQWYKYELSLLAEWWEYYEEPKGYWYLTDAGCLCQTSIHNDKTAIRKRIGNYFETKEEAEKAVEKLKAWKRLKDKGFRFNRRYKPNYGEIFVIECRLPKETLIVDVVEDLDLLFGGEE